MMLITNSLMKRQTWLRNVSAQMSALAVVKIIRSLASDGGFNAVFAPLQVVLADQNCLKCRFQVTKETSNSLNTLHGGYIATLVDFISSVDLVRRGRLAHVSVELSTSYVKAAKMDSWVSVESYILKLGKTLAFCEVSLFDEA
uniref:Acyl-coenzyme A thioesterase 13 n=1 Tax=Schistocephalus solidus TaxID=70667 RepID=A0A0X3Q012_SCHSO